MKAVRFTLWGAVGTAALLAWLAWQSQSGPRTAALEIGMPFTLASSKGGALVSSDSLKGKPYAMFFGFTHCPVICPTTLYEMDTALKTLGDEGKGACSSFPLTRSRTRKRSWPTMSPTSIRASRG